MAKYYLVKRELYGWQLPWRGLKLAAVCPSDHLTTMDALKSLMASPKRLLEAVGEYVADKVVGPVPTMQSLAEEDSPSALTHPPVAAPAVTAPAVAIKRQPAAAPVVAVKRQSIAAPTVARGGGVKKASPGSKKKVSPLKTVKPEPVSKASPS